jgi:diadenosine tetraphosphatase ApaH/serine/threonine PP2A family protein phosphatase
MRYGVIADVHANLHALDATLEFLAAQDLDAYLCAGDLVGYGPLPDESVRRVLELPGRCVAGNHELIVLGRLSDARCSALARASLRWTREAIGDETRALLAGLPLAARADGVAIHHGSPVDPQEYVLTERRAQDCLDELGRVAPGADILILGHTHLPMAVSRGRGALARRPAGAVPLPPGDPVVLNPGSVGQSRSRDARARFLVLDTAERVATFHALPYDEAACRRALRERGLPPASCHVPRSRLRAAAGAVMRRVRG